MREAAFFLKNPAQRQWPSRACWLLAGFMVVVSISSALAAPGRSTRGSAAQAIRAASSPPPRQATAPTRALNLPGTIDQQIALLDRSARFWRQFGATIEGVDQRTALVLSFACEEQARTLEARQARAQGRRSEAHQLVQQATQARRSWRQLAGTRAQPGAGAVAAMPGVAPGADMGMPPGMPTGPDAGSAAIDAQQERMMQQQGGNDQEGVVAGPQ